MMTDTYDDASIGGTNLFASAAQGSAYHEQFRNARTVRFDEPGLRITRLRLISDPGFPAWDISYCHGYIGDEPVHVDMVVSQLAKWGFKFKRKDGTIGKGGWKAHVIALCKKYNVNAWKLGVLENVSTLN